MLQLKNLKIIILISLTSLLLCLLFIFICGVNVMPVAYADSIIEPSTSTTVNLYESLTDVEKAIILWGFVILFWARFVIKKLFPNNIILYYVSVELYLLYLVYRLSFFFQITSFQSWFLLLVLLGVIFIYISLIYRYYFPQTSSLEKKPLSGVALRWRRLQVSLSALLACFSEIAVDSIPSKPKYLQFINKYIRYDLVYVFMVGSIFVCDFFLGFDTRSTWCFSLNVFTHIAYSIIFSSDSFYIGEHYKKHEAYYSKRFATIYSDTYAAAGVFYSESSEPLVRVESIYPVGTQSYLSKLFPAGLFYFSFIFFIIGSLLLFKDWIFILDEKIERVDLELKEEIREGLKEYQQNVEKYNQNVEKYNQAVETFNEKLKTSDLRYKHKKRSIVE